MANSVDKYGNSELMRAAAKGDEAALKRLLASDPNLDLQNKDGDTALMVAVDKGQKGAVQHIIHAKCSLNIQNKFGDTALIKAAWVGHKGIIKLLVDADADTNIKNKDGQTALMVAAQRNLEDPVNALLNGLYPANVNAQDLEGCTALMISAREGHEAVVKALLDAAADCNLLDKQGKTAAAMAPKGGPVADILKKITSASDVLLTMFLKDLKVESAQDALMELGVEAVEDLALLDVPDIDDMVEKGTVTAEVGAIVKAHVMKFKGTEDGGGGGGGGGVDFGLMESMAELNSKDTAGLTPLMRACKDGDKEASEALLKVKADVSLVDNEGKTALMHAAGMGSEELVQLLLDKGGDPNALDQAGKTALVLAKGSPAAAILKPVTAEGKDLLATFLTANGLGGLHALLDEEGVECVADLAYLEEADTARLAAAASLTPEQTTTFQAFVAAAVAK
eukprot:CAMPEP_0181314744 /NCGR_PEP_ID=MMETSP1101-20121128/14985_1 /TAXON_ID=46948 /ORGANISM="Rhodomonas abbreviata, Strain Caron Lab Isolate" /LENGTH=451 /DNA_ID=CAMNT_0023421865 /DNA_START=38 /DNA_END=1394 /DNA_ORIENTATION=+